MVNIPRGRHNLVELLNEPVLGLLETVKVPELGEVAQERWVLHDFPHDGA